VGKQAWLSSRNAIEPVPCSPPVAPQGLKLPMFPSCQNEVDAPEGGVESRLGRGSESATSRLHRRAETSACEGRFRLEGCTAREAASLSGSSPLGLKRSQAQQGQPVWMILAGHQLARALALALGTPAAQEAAVVQEEAQQVQVRATEVAAQREVAAQPRVEVLHERTWFKTGGLWVTPKVARAAPTKGFHVSRVTRI